MLPRSWDICVTSLEDARRNEDSKSMPLHCILLWSRNQGLPVASWSSWDFQPNTLLGGTLGSQQAHIPSTHPKVGMQAAPESLMPPQYWNFFYQKVREQLPGSLSLDSLNFCKNFLEATPSLPPASHLPLGSEKHSPYPSLHRKNLSSSSLLLHRQMFSVSNSPPPSCPSSDGYEGRQSMRSGCYRAGDLVTS